MLLGHWVCSELLHIFPWVFTFLLQLKNGEITPKPCSESRAGATPVFGGLGGFGDPLPNWVMSPCQPQIQGWDFPPSLLIYRRKGSFLWPFGAFKGRTFQLFSFQGLWWGAESLWLLCLPPPEGPCPFVPVPAHLPGELQDLGDIWGLLGEWFSTESLCCLAKKKRQFKYII